LIDISSFADEPYEPMIKKNKKQFLSGLILTQLKRSY